MRQNTSDKLSVNIDHVYCIDNPDEDDCAEALKQLEQIKDETDAIGIKVIYRDLTNNANLSFLMFRKEYIIKKFYK